MADFNELLAALKKEREKLPVGNVEVFLQHAETEQMFRFYVIEGKDYGPGYGPRIFIRITDY